MKHIKRISALLLAAMMLLSLCACSSTGNRKQTQTASAPGSSYNYSYAVNDMAMGEAMAAEEAEYGLAPVPMPTNASAKTAGGEADSEPAADTPDKIIYSADVTVETTAFRIPSKRFQELMDSLSGLGNIPYSHIYTENVTAQYYDVQAHLKAYQTQETRLLEMMELAETVEDVIILEDRLTELRYKIESLQSSLNNWDRRVSYSTISLSVKEVREYTPEEKVNPTYGEELLQALKDGLENAGEFLKNLLVFLVEVLPVLIILVPIIWLVVWLLRKLIRKLTAKAAARREKRRAAKAAARAVPAAEKSESAEKPGDAR